MKSVFVILLGVIPILALSIVLVSFSQTNDTLSNDAQFDEPTSDDASSNESSFSSWSRELAENQTQSDAESDENEE
jgi:hypothetical protein